MQRKRISQAESIHADLLTKWKSTTREVLVMNDATQRGGGNNKGREMWRNTTCTPTGPPARRGESMRVKIIPGKHDHQGGGGYRLKPQRMKKR